MTRYTVSPDAACAVVDDGAVVLHMRTKRYYSLNETGGAIWAMLEAGAPVESIVADLVANYDVEAPAAAAEVTRMLGELAAADLVRLEGA